MLPFVAVGEVGFTVVAVRVIFIPAQGLGAVSVKLVLALQPFTSFAVTM
jgi:hypothetical protein